MTRLSSRDIRRLGPGARAQIKAKADVSKLKPYYPYDSKTEAVFAKVGAVLLRGFLRKKIVHLEYHPVEFILPGETYRIDFLAIAADGEQFFVECKGTNKSKNYRDSRSKLRAAAARFPYWNFLETRWPDQRRELAWKIERIKSD
jgi:hypothetical protein